MTTCEVYFIYKSPNIIVTEDLTAFQTNEYIDENDLNVNYFFNCCYKW